MKVDYNLLSEEYAQHRKVNRRMFGQLLQESHLTSDSRVLEVGCGTGNYLTAIAEGIGCACWGIDPSREMLARAREQCDSMHLVEGRAEALAFPEGFFDLIFSVDVIHHLASQLAYYQCAFQSLKPGGMICTVTESRSFIRRRKPFSTYFPDTISVDIGRYPSIEALEAMLARVGFENVHRRTTNTRYTLTDIQRYRDRAYSCLHLISDEAFYRGLECMERDLLAGPIPHVSNYMLVWGTRPRMD